MDNSLTILPDGRMDTRNAAAYLGMAEAYLGQLRHRGKGPRYVQPAGDGGKVWYFQADLDAWLQSDTKTEEKPSDA